MLRFKRQRLASAYAPGAKPTYETQKRPSPERRSGGSVIGPSGKLRAPAIRKGKTLVVGFHPEAYGEVV